MKNLIIVLLFFSTFQGLYSQDHHVDSIQTLLKQAKGTKKVDLLIDIARSYYLSDKIKFLSYSQEAKSISQELSYKKGLSRALCNLGIHYEGTGNCDLALKYYHQALKTADSTDHRIRITTLINISVCEQDLTRRLNYLNEVLKLSKKSKFEKIGFVYNSLGDNYYSLSSYDKAISSYMEGIEASKANEDSASLSFNLKGLSLVLQNQQSYDQALFYLKQVLDICQKTGDIVTTAETLSLISYSLARKGQLDSALKVSYKSVELASDEKFYKYSLLVKCLLNTGSILQDQKKFEKAIPYYLKALSTNSEENNLLDQMDVLTKLGESYNSLKMYQKAESYLTQAVEIGKKLRANNGLTYAYKELSQAYIHLNQPLKAYQYLELSQLYKDSVWDLEANEQVVQMATKYEVADKEKAILLLNKNNRIKDLTIAQNKIELILALVLSAFILGIAILFYLRYRTKVKTTRIIEQANSNILLLLKEKEVLLQEIHHRIKNNLQLISSLLKWQSESITDKKAMDKIDEGRSRIKSIALIHELLYQSENLSRISFKCYLEHLIGHFDKIYNQNKSIEVIHKIDDIIIDIDRIMQLGLIVNELLTNSFKYAFPYPSQGKIEITLIKLDSFTLFLRVKDDGIGLPEEIINNKQYTTMGLQLVKTLVKQFKGKIDIYNSGGTVCDISFPFEEVVEDRKGRYVDSHRVNG